MNKQELDKYFGNDPGGLGSMPPLGIVPRTIAAGNDAGKGISEYEFCKKRNKELLETLKRYVDQDYYTDHAHELIKEFINNSVTICVIKQRDIQYHEDLYKVLPEIDENIVEGVKWVTHVIGISNMAVKRLQKFIDGCRNDKKD